MSTQQIVTYSCGRIAVYSCIFNFYTTNLESNLNKNLNDISLVT